MASDGQCTKLVLGHTTTTGNVMGQMTRVMGHTTKVMGYMTRVMGLTTSGNIIKVPNGPQ